MYQTYRCIFSSTSMYRATGGLAHRAHCARSDAGAGSSHYVRPYNTKAPKPEIPRNQLRELFSANEQSSNGIVYDKKPFKITLESGRTYSWCLCGRSKTQPLCDGTHKDIFLKISQRPIRFTVEKSKDYWLCNCKQTKNRPFCDGTHKHKDVQDATSVKV